ncbi:MAG: hypothetical protein WCE38_21450 [Burkholderiales bacterium]
MTDHRARLVAVLEQLDETGRRTLVEYAEFLVSRRKVQANPPIVAARPPGETVLQAIKRLNRSYSGLRRAALMQPVGELLSQHMVDGRAAEEVIEDLEALYARAHAERAAR